MPSTALTASPNQTASSTTYIRTTPTSTSNRRSREFTRPSVGEKSPEVSFSRSADLSDDNSGPLTNDLRRILSEVAQSGTCSWLPWSSPEGDIERSSRLNFIFPKRQGGGSSHSKRKRNGIHTLRRLSEGNAKSTPTIGRKRARTTYSVSLSGGGGLSGAASVGSCKTSGSEIEDSTQYECDSEGTSTTTNSEVSLTRKRVLINAAPVTNQPQSSRFKSLKSAVAAAAAAVMDHSFRHRGYHMSKTELRLPNNIPEGNLKTGRMHPTSDGGVRPGQTQMSSQQAFERRRQRILSLLGVSSKSLDVEDHKKGSTMKQKGVDDGPPFTLQRLAEVLVDPERYYAQTHKICNCLEKLLLVKSSINAFGGSSGGETSQTRREDEELAALADEKERLESEERNRRLRRRMSASSVEDERHMREEGKKLEAEEKVPSEAMVTKTKKASQQKRSNVTSFVSNTEDSRMLQQNGGHTQRVNEAHDARSMTKSPPPPAINNSTTPSRLPGYVRQSSPDQVKQMSEVNGSKALHQRALSPIMFSQSESGTNPMLSNVPNHGLQVLQIHHAAAMAGILGSTAPLDFVINANSQQTVQNANIGSTPGDQDLEVSNGLVPTQFGSTAQFNCDGSKADPGRSSASNSDVDSESDDVSFDDSASDRSDGSDSGSGHYEPFTAARMMALNRKQQQQQRSQQGRSGDFRPPADTEYQSGDSIDSMLAEDSGGSDSSSSDLAD